MTEPAADDRLAAMTAIEAELRVLDVADPFTPDDTVASPIAALREELARRPQVTHIEHLPRRDAVAADWPAWVPDQLLDAWGRRGITRPWRHQVETAERAWRGEHLVVSTGTASGKSIGYLMPALSAALTANSTSIYLSPTKALAADQLRSIRALELDGIRAATIDGDSSDDEREWARRHASLVLTNPDMLHRSLLPSHQRWSVLWRRLRFVIIDEAHGYRGVFGAHVAMVLRRLRRIAERHGASPTFVLASATLADAARSASRLTGLDVSEIVTDTSPRGRLSIALWEPPLEPRGGSPETAGEPGSAYPVDPDAATHRSTTAEVADILTDLVCRGLRSVAFVRSRRAAESIAQGARRRLAESHPRLVGRIATYRGGYLPEERRALERDLHSGRLLGVASTNALELGVDISGLDAVVIGGWPGTRASLWQQAGRAGRGRGDAVAIFVARDDPLDTYLVRHPDALFGRPLEACVFDPDNPVVVAPHLAAAAAEAPITAADVELFGGSTPAILDSLVESGLLRKRSTGWFWTRRERASDLTDIRGSGGRPVQICEAATGRLLGTVDASSADSTVHGGAIYVHQGDSFVVDSLDLDDAVALVHAETPDWTTMARSASSTHIVDVDRSEEWLGGKVRLDLGRIDVTTQVTSYLRRRLRTGEILGEWPLDLPVRNLRTVAVWWTLDPAFAESLVDLAALPGALHAAEHASIGLLPLIATCDRWDLGGLSTECHPETGRPTVFVYDGHEGGAGFAARGFAKADAWLSATRDAISGCQCDSGCPACVQSPKCGNGNEPLHKSGAVTLLDALLAREGAGA